MRFCVTDMAEFPAYEEGGAKGATRKCISNGALPHMRSAGEMV
jgi:hypothetical protein